MAVMLLPFLLAGCPGSVPWGPLEVDASSVADHLEADGDPWDALSAPDGNRGDSLPVEPDLGPATGGLAECEPQALWTWLPEVHGFTYGRTTASLSPNGALVAVQSAFGRYYLRLGDGHFLGHDSLLQGAGTDGQWGLEVAPGSDSLFVRETAGGQVLFELLPPQASDPALDWLASVDAAIDPEGRHAAGLACWRSVGSGGSESALSIWELDQGSLVRTVTLDEPCDGLNWLEMPILTFAGDLGILVAVPGSTRLYRVDVEGDGTDAFDLAAGVEPGEPVTGTPLAYVPFLSPIVDLARSPSGEHLAVVLHDGTLRRYSLPGLEPVGSPIPAGFAGINLMTYGPSTAAPVAWSSDGQLLAHLSPNGDLAITDASNGSLLRTLPNPEAESAGAAPDFLNPPIAFRFTHGGEGLLAVHEMGVVFWHCGAPESPVATSLEVTIEGPEKLVEGEAGTWTFFHPEIGGPAIHVLVEEGLDSPLAASLSASVPAHLWLPGTHALVGTVDSGLATGVSAPLPCELLPAP